MKYRIDIFSDCSRWATLIKRVYVEVENAEQALQIAKNMAKQGQGYEVMQVASDFPNKSLVYEEPFKKYIYKITESNLIWVWEHYYVIEFKDDGSIKKQYDIPGKRVRNREF